MKVPKEAKLVFKGIIYDVYHWEQKLFDGTFSTFEILKRKYTSEVIAVNGEKIFISHQSQPTKEDFYTLFGGRVEEGESPLEAAKRELAEEGGFTSNSWEEYKVYEPFHKIDWEIHTYIARDCIKLESTKFDAGEKGEVIECTFEEFIDYVLSDKYWGTELTLEILRLKEKGNLDILKKRFFGT